MCYALVGDTIVHAIDHKPKAGKRLARVRNIARDARVALLIDRWDEDWTRLAWVMVRGNARVEAPVPEVVKALATRYPQYEGTTHEAIIVVEPHEILWWSWT